MSKVEISIAAAGMFYRRPSPEAAAFGNDGDSVAADDVIGLVEVMKSFHEVKAGRERRHDPFRRRGRGRDHGGPDTGGGRGVNIRSVLIANRGEIAVRIVRAAKALGLRTVQVYSQADVDSPRCGSQMKRSRLTAGGQKSYLNAGAILAAAKACKVDAIHPGYGFLENGDFADAVVAAGFVFVGPSGAAIRLLGDKVAARQAAAKAGATAPGSSRRTRGRSRRGQALAAAIGFPLMIKAAAGGGGRGIRIVQTLSEFEQQFPQASAEAAAAFATAASMSRKSSNERAMSKCRFSATARILCSLFRARVLAAAPPPEGLGGGAGGKASPARGARNALR